MEFTNTSGAGQDQNSYDVYRHYYLRPNYRQPAKHKEYVPFTAAYSPFPSAVTEPPASTIDRILFDKDQVLQQRMDSIIYQIQARRDLYEENMRRIDYQDCGISGKIDFLDEWMPFRQLNQVVERRKESLERELHQLDTERRAERVRAWEDVQRLYKDLLDTISDYRAALRTQGLIEGEESGGD